MASPILQGERGYSADFRICKDYLVSCFYLLHKILYIFVMSSNRNIFTVFENNYRFDLLKTEGDTVNGFAVVVSSYTESELTRIISARISTAEEEKRYEEWCRQFYS